jgi:TusA-related sulfurtransferase
MASSAKHLQVDQSLDARGTAYPVAYQRAAEQLKAMEEDRILELYLDDGEALRTVPFALRAEGHEILVSEPAQPGVRLLVKKRSLIA